VENNIFTVTSDDLRRLDAKAAVVLVSELLWAEATSLGIPISKVQISAEVTTADDGVDAKVSGHNISSDLIRLGHAAYQIKSGETFQPQQESAIRNELFGDQKEVNKKNLKRRVCECLDENGTYILVCTGTDCVDRSAVEAFLLKNFKSCGYTHPKVEVWLQNQLCGFLTKYPSIALNVNRRDIGALRAHKSWSGDAEMEKEFKPGAKQLELISNLQTALRVSESAVQVHIRGEAGIGKTRLVLEATRALDLQPLVLYTSSPAELLDSQFIATLVREDNHYAVILVVDECNAEYRTRIWDRLKSRGSRIKLITIFNEIEAAVASSILDAPPLEPEQIISIIQSYGIPKDQAERFVGFCSGSPRVAHVLGINLRMNPEDLLKPPDTINIWERYIVGIDDKNSQIVKDRFVVLRHIALFKRFGYSNPVAEEAKAISAIIEKDYPLITWSKFQEIIGELRNRKTLQGETTLYITPQALHIWLWIDWWNIHGQGFNLEQFVQDFKGGLLQWYFEMFKYAEQSAVARKVVEKLLEQDGPFSDKKFINTILGGNFFLALTDVDPHRALICLQNTIGTWSRDELLEFHDGRRSIIWALERIAIWKDEFCGAANLLLKLAEAENETWANNATGVFADLFSPATGEVAPTEASPQERFPILQDALTSQSEIIRKIALKACDSALEARHFTRMIGAEHQGFKQKPKLWMPKTYGEIWDAYRQVWNLIRKQLPVLSAQQREEAAKILLNNGLPIASGTNLGLLVLETWKEIYDKAWAAKSDVIHHLMLLLRYERKQLRPEIVKAAELLRDEMAGKDFQSILKRYVGMDLLEDKFDENGQPIDTAAQQIRALAQQCLVEPIRLQQELSWLVTDEAKNGFLFGYELGRLDENNSILEMILEAQRKSTGKNNVFFLCGYMRALFEIKPAMWEETLDRLTKEEQLKAHVPELTWRSGMTDQAALRILNLAKAGQMEIHRFGIFCYGAAIKDISENVFEQWAVFLLAHADIIAINILLNFIHFYYLQAKSNRKLPLDLTLQALGNEILFKGNAQFQTMDRHYWTGVGIAFAKSYPKESLKLAEIIVENFGNDGTVVGGFHSTSHNVLMEIARQNPEEAWNLIAARLGPPIDSRAYHLKSWLRGEQFSSGGESGVLPIFPPELIWKWVDTNTEKRAWYIASFVPKQLFRSNEKPCLAREVLIRYGNDEKVRRNLMSNFSTEGWSGSASGHYQIKKQWLLDFKKDETDPNVKLWIDEYINDLQSMIDHAKVREEREF
jgi:hypothetical protein